MLFYANGSHSQIVSDRWAYKVSAGVYSQDPLARPDGQSAKRRCRIPPSPTKGTTQPKLDVRADYDFEDGQRKLVFQGGVAGTDGILHSGIGPFDINSGTVLGYGKVNYSKGAMKLNFFTNILNGDATNLLAVGLNGQPLNFIFKSNTYDVEFGDVRTFQQRHVVSYGGNFRFSNFDLSIAPAADSRKEGGGYLQDEIFLGKYVRLLLGARVDKFDIIEDVQFSPRTTLMLKPTPDQTIRLSYNRAYRAPSVINNFLDTTIINQLPLRFARSTRPWQRGLQLPGARRRQQHRLCRRPACRRRTWSSSRLPRTRSATPASSSSGRPCRRRFSSTRPKTTSSSRRSPRTAPPTRRPDGRRPPIPPFLGGIILEGALLPARLHAVAGAAVSVRRRQRPAVGIQLPQPGQGGAEGPRAGHRRRPHQGVERVCQLLVPARSEGDRLSAVRDQPAAQQPLQRRRELRRGSRYLGSLAVSYQDEAYWQDVLDNRYAGTTDAFTLVNGTLRRQVGQQAQHRDAAEGHQPAQRRDPAAHLRGHVEAAGGGRVAGGVLTDCRLRAIADCRSR